MEFGILRRERAGALHNGWRSGLLVLTVLLAIVAAIADLLTPPDVVFFWLVLIAPVLAATLLRPWAVTLVGLVAFAMVLIMTARHGLAGTTAQTLRLGVILAMTVLSAAFSYRLGILEKRAHRGAQHESTLAAIVHSTQDAVITTDLDGTIVTWNEGATRQYGWSAEEAIGREIALVYPPDQLAGLPETMATLREGGSIGVLEARRVCRDGTTVDVSVSMSPIRDRRGQVVAIACIERDVTVLKRAEEQRRQIMERSALAERLESLGQLAGGIAHDFNNLLAINLNYLDFVLEQTTDADAHQDLTRARASAERARELTRQLLLFARQEPGDSEIIDLDAVIEDARALLGRTIGGHIELIARPSPQPLSIRADWGRMEQILLNLVINARDAMPDGGTVSIEASAVQLDDDPDRLPPLPAGPYAQLQVSDTGIGMTPEVAARIFEPFFTTKAKQHGTGLGLATVYAIVTEAGGDISVSSEPGIGTTFRILLPAVTADTAAQGDAATAVGGNVGRRILVVEDDAEVRRITVRILEGEGYQVSQAEHGRAALERIQRRPFDLLLTDVIMPEMSGSRLAETVRIQYPGVRILLISGYSEETAKVQHLVLDGIPLIHKPFTADELLDAVRQALGVTTNSA
ncbi:PAS domain S-box protein [Krasilnikovia sp. M28-CT-15]|uniref:PAS domain S-box protein n=1 Tax=Krasilnikovia sp. M28-CT-15 TaxID=3373540 RepID=UPI0038765D95